jgi:hypothetical protein
MWVGVVVPEVSLDTTRGKIPEEADVRSGYLMSDKMDSYYQDSCLSHRLCPED